MHFSILITLFIFCCQPCSAQYSPCIGVSKITVPCLEYIGHTLKDPNLYSFGNAFVNKLGCNYQDVTDFGSFVSSRNAKCANQRPANKSGTYLTVGSRIYLDNDYKSIQHMGQLEGILGVQFVSSAPYVYHGCNSSAQITTPTIINVYPGGPVVPAVLARDSPKINFPACNTNNLCTIIFYDVGHLVVHNIWTNWPKENSGLPNFLHPGHGGMYPNPYVFLVFRQSGEIQPIKADITAIPVGGFNLDELVKQNNLKGPIAINWIDIITDLTAQESLTNFGLGNYCATILNNILIAENLKVQLDLGVKIPINLDVWMTVKFDNSWVDSIQNGFISKDKLKAKPQTTLEMELFLPKPEDFKDSLYSLVLVQSPPVVLQSSPKIAVHWLVTDIPSGDVTKGVEIIPYKEPEANQYLSNQFYFLLFKQTKSIEKGNVDKLCTSTPCMLQLAQLVNDNHLTLSSLARFRTTVFP